MRMKFISSNMMKMLGITLFMSSMTAYVLPASDNWNDCKYNSHRPGTYIEQLPGSNFFVIYFQGLGLQKNWIQANDWCVNHKCGSLAILDTGHKRNQLEMASLPVARKYWVGLKYNGTRHVWVDGTPANWTGVSYQNKEEERKCYYVYVRFDGEYVFKNTDCDDQILAMICEVRSSTTSHPVKATPTPSSMQTSQASSSANVYMETTSAMNPTKTSSMQPSAVKSTVKTPIPSLSSVDKGKTSMQTSQASSSANFYMGTTSAINPTKASSMQPSSHGIPSVESTRRPNPINHFHDVMKNLNTSDPDCMSVLLTEYDNLIEGMDAQDKDMEYNPLTDAQNIEDMAMEFTKQHLSSERKNLSISKKEIAFHAMLVDSDIDSDVIFPKTPQGSDINTISLPKSLFKGQDTYIVNVVYKNNKTIPKLTPTVMEAQDNKKKWSVNTGIFSTTIFPKRNEPFEYVNITLHHIQKMEYAKPHCSFWNFSIATSYNGSWSQQGCHVVSSKDMQTVCACNHLTNFAVLMNLNSDEVPSVHKDVLLVITNVGLGLSLLGEAITVILYCVFLNLRHEKIQIRVNLLCALAAAQVIFLAGIDKTENKILCTFVAALIHLLYLVCFCWMVMEGVYLYRIVVKVFDAHMNMRYSYIFTFAFPLGIVTVSLIAASAQSEGINSYINNEYCWIRSDNDFIWFFIAPVLVLIAINTFLLFSVLKEMALMKSVKTTNSLELSSIRASARACVVLLPVLGITWLFGLVSLISSAIWWQYVFTILNALQGFMIFVFHCLRNTEVFAENSLIKNIFEEEKKFDSRT